MVSTGHATMISNGLTDLMQSTTLAICKVFLNTFYASERMKVSRCSGSTTDSPPTRWYSGNRCVQNHAPEWAVTFCGML